VRAFPLVFGEVRNGTVSWDGKDARGAPVPAGIYWIRLDTDDGPAITRKVLRLR
jgi:hypothetical protein